MRGITPEGFHIFNPAYIGNHQVIYTPYGDAKIAHPERVYFCQVTVKRAISQSFAVLSDGYACDDKHIFWGKSVGGCGF